jgi:transposase
VWAERGSRPEAVKQTEYDWVYLYASVNPATGASSAMLAPTVNAAYMSEHLRMVGAAAGPGAHVVLVLDGAGWHVAKALAVPANVTLLPLPPYSPKLNPVERVWGYLRDRYLSCRVYKDYDHVFDAAAAAWNRLDEARLQSLCATAWLTLAD